ncbi:MAG: hypothetical protein AAB150_02345 [Pseudomonadota bacterium]
MRLSLVLWWCCICVGQPAPESRFEAGDVVVLGELDALEAAGIRLLRGTK